MATPLQQSLPDANSLQRMAKFRESRRGSCGRARDRGVAAPLPFPRRPATFSRWANRKSIGSRLSAVRGGPPVPGPLPGCCPWGGGTALLPSHGRYRYSADRPPARLRLAGRPAPRRLRRPEPRALRLRRGARRRARPRRPAAGRARTSPGATTATGSAPGGCSTCFDGLGLPCSVLRQHAPLRLRPELVAAFRARGDEIVGHGRTNAERQGALAEDEERALIAEATATIARHEGRPPAGWLGPWISREPRDAGPAGRGGLLATCSTGATTTSRSGSRRAAGPILVGALPAGAERHPGDRRAQRPARPSSRT